VPIEGQLRKVSGEQSPNAAAASAPGLPPSGAAQPCRCSRLVLPPVGVSSGSLIARRPS
jgi:hypothetical protein